MQSIEHLRIFIVENHGDTLQSLKIYFEDLGHEVKTASTVAQALSDLPSYNPDLLLCDIGLPDGTGWELLNQLEPKPVFAVAMSGFGMHAESARSREVGFRSHLLKPFKVSELDKILAEAAAKPAQAPMPASRTSSHSQMNDVVQAIEWEQRRLGRRLHDSICQTLAGTNILLEQISNAVATGRPVSPEGFAKLKSIVQNAIRQTRSLSQQFIPVDLYGTGLMTALQDLASATPNCDFQCEKPVVISDESVALALYRIAQEALSNAVTHSAAKSFGIVLMRKDNQVVLQVSDSGRGFVPGGEPGKWTGIATMKLRANSVGGLLELESAPGSGTTVRCTVPLPS